MVMQNNHGSLVQRMLELGCNANAQNGTGQTVSRTLADSNRIPKTALADPGWGQGAAVWWGGG